MVRSAGDSTCSKIVWKLAGLAEAPAEAAALHSPINIDRVYVEAPARLHLDDGHEHLAISQSGFGDTVVWNPGGALCARLADLPPDGYRSMLCVEAALIDRPITLAPGQQWQGWQELRVLPAP